MSGGLLGRVDAQQVMHAIPARPGGLDQVRPGQQLKQPAGLFNAAKHRLGQGSLPAATLRAAE